MNAVKLVAEVRNELKKLDLRIAKGENPQVEIERTAGKIIRKVDANR